jgi:pimeloyl-ACP methyl ester carboxylesterase
VPLDRQVVEMPEIKLSQGRLKYRDEGEGEPIVLIHGLLVNGAIWDRVVPALAQHGRVIVPDLPLGSHTVAMDPDAPQDPPAVAALIAELIERLDLRDVTLVGNDTGGALCQLTVAAHPERIGRLVLTNCDAFEHFPPPPFDWILKGLGRIPGAVLALPAFGRLRLVRKASFATLSVAPVPDELVLRWLAPLRDPAIRRDLIKFLRAIDSEHTLRAAEQLRTFDRPVLIVWGVRDAFFKLADAHRLVALFPDARLEQVENARTFVQLDAPGRVAELVSAFASLRQPDLTAQRA